MSIVGIISFSFVFFILCYIVVIMRENNILKLSFRKEKKRKTKFRFYKECNFDIIDKNVSGEFKNGW